MKFSIQREVILKPLMQVIGVVERRQTLPVLANLLVNAKDNELRFTGTDLEVELMARVSLSVEQPGEVTIPARKLVDICKALPDGTQLDIEIGSERATIRGGQSRFTLTTLPANEFPVVEDVDVSESVQISQGDLKYIIERSSFAMANQDVRYYLNGCCLSCARVWYAALPPMVTGCRFVMQMQIWPWRKPDRSLSPARVFWNCYVYLMAKVTR